MWHKGEIVRCGISSGQKSSEAAVQFPAGGLARGAPVGTCPRTRGLECQGAAALYRAALLELQCGLRPIARVSGASHPGCPPRPEVKSALSGAALRHLWRRLPTRPPAPARSHPTVPCPFCRSRLRHEHRRNSPPDLRNREVTQPSLLVSGVRPGVPCVL